MSRERALIEQLRALATHPAARELRDDAAVLVVGDRQLVLTHDLLVEGVHYLPGDPAADVAWKLVAVNLSDLAAKAATPLGVLLGFPLGDAAWDRAFVTGLGAALAAFGVPLLGGDTVAGRGARTLGLTAIGEARSAPARSGAQRGDLLYVTGSIGLAGLGLAVARGATDGPSDALAAYRRPRPRLAEGQALGSRAHAMMDVSDGLLIDAARMAEASGLACTIALDRVPIPPGMDPLAAVTAGDDYELLVAAPAGLTLSQPDLARLTPIGRFAAGAGLSLTHGGTPVPLPARLGYEHGAV
jgi:thiamine-monophosphate kinase